MTKRTTSAAWVKGVTDMFASQGLDVPQLCEAAGVRLQSLQEPLHRCATENVSALWDVALQRSQNPHLALAAPGLVQPANFEAVGFAMMSSATVRAALERLIRYLRIVSDAAMVDVVERNGLHWVELDLYGGDAAIPSQRFVFDLLALLTFLRWSVGKPLQPQRAEFTQACPADASAYTSAFQCPVTFGQSRNAMGFSASALDTPLLSANAVVSELHDQFAVQRLEQLNLSNTSYRAKEIIAGKLLDGEPRREEVAAALCMSERTLMRRLQDEGSSYNQLLDATRRELAQRYLRQKNLSLGQITYLLGFADQSNFFRACKRWFDASPSQYRALH